ncbi:hypothetical protein ACTXT7_003104 [Hymenolepis weldensis]
MTNGFLDNLQGEFMNSGPFDRVSVIMLRELEPYQSNGRNKSGHTCRLISTEVVGKPPQFIDKHYTTSDWMEADSSVCLQFCVILNVGHIQ